MPLNWNKNDILLHNLLSFDYIGELEPLILYRVDFGG